MNVLNEPKKHIMSARAGPGMVPLESSPVALAQGPGRGFLTALTPGAQPGSGARPSTGHPFTPLHSLSQPRLPSAAKDAEAGAAEPRLPGLGTFPMPVGLHRGALGVGVGSLAYGHHFPS